MLRGSHLHDYAPRNPIHTTVLVDFVAVLIKVTEREDVPATQLAT